MAGIETALQVNLQHLPQLFEQGMARHVDNVLMETQIEHAQPLRILRQRRRPHLVHNAPQLVQILRAGKVNRPANGQILQHSAHTVEFLYVLAGKRCHHNAFVGGTFHQPFVFQLTQRFA